MIYWLIRWCDRPSESSFAYSDLALSVSWSLSALADPFGVLRTAVPSPRAGQMACACGVSWGSGSAAYLAVRSFGGRQSVSIRRSREVPNLPRRRRQGTRFGRVVKFNRYIGREEAGVPTGACARFHGLVFARSGADWKCKCRRSGGGSGLACHFLRSHGDFSLLEKQAGLRTDGQLVM